MDDPQKGVFLLDRETLVSEDVLRGEMRNIFSKCWIYVGHSSELKKPAISTLGASPGVRVIFARGRQGQRALLPQHLPPSRRA